MTTSTGASLHIPFTSPWREAQARLFASRILESWQTAFGEQQQIHTNPRFKLRRTRPGKNQQLEMLLLAATWLAEEARPCSADCEAVLALLFFSHDIRVPLVKLSIACVRALAAYVRSADPPRAFEDEEYCYYFKLLQALNDLLLLLSHATGDHLQTAFRVVASLALKLDILSACSELMATVSPKAGQPKMRRGEVKLVLNVIEWPLQMVTCTCALLNEPAPSKPIVNLLVEAMASSNFVEHSARALTLALEAFHVPGTRGIEPSGSCAKALLGNIGSMCGSLVGLHIYGEDTTTLSAIRNIMLGPCLQYTLSASIVSTLASLDGGTLYGMTTPVPLLKDFLPSLLELWYWLFNHTPPSKLLPYSPGAVRRVCSRLLDVARMSIMLESAAQPVAPRGRQQQLQPEQASSPSLREPLLPKSSFLVAQATLRCYAFMCPYPLVQNVQPGGKWAQAGTTTTTHSPAAAAAAVEYWCKAVPTLNGFIDYIAGKDRNVIKLRIKDVLGALEITVGDLPDGEPVPPPTPSLTAALAAGYVPLLERTLRVLAPDNDIVHLLRVFCDQSRMGALLSYGDPREVASLLATGDKLLKRLLHSDDEEQIEVMKSIVLDWMFDFLGAELLASREGVTPVAGGPSSTVQAGMAGVHVSDRARGKGSPSGSEATPKRTPSMSQPASLISTCVPRWLLLLAALARLPLTDLTSKTRLVIVMIKSLLWIPPVVAAMEIEEGRLHITGCESSGGSGNIGSKGHKFGWRRFLLQQWDVLGQLGLCLQLVSTTNLTVLREMYAFMMDMAYLGLGWVLSVQPGEVAAGIKDGRLPVLTVEQLFHCGAAMPPQLDVGKWQKLLSGLQDLKKGKEVTVQEVVVQHVWAAMPKTTKIGSLLVLANRPAAREPTSKGSEASACTPGQPPRLRLCANPGCDNLAGDSEAALPLKVCGGCGAVWYCRRECQAAHWRAGHKAECGAMRDQSH